jgi:hypothetical protein
VFSQIIDHLPGKETKVKNMVPILVFLTITHLLIFLGGMRLGYAIKIKDSVRFDPHAKQA